MRSDTARNIAKLGVGLNYQPQLRPFLQNFPGEIDFLEVVPDIFWVDHGPEAKPRYVDDTAALQFLHSMRRHIPVVPHGIGLSIGSAHRFNREHVVQLAHWVDRFGVPWHSDHLSYHLSAPTLAADHAEQTTAAESNVGITMPLPRTQTTLARLKPRIKYILEVIRNPFLLENNVYFVDLPDDEMGEAEFLNLLCAETGCGLLLDLHNVYVNSCNMGFDPLDLVASVNLENVVEIHLAGGTWDDDYYLDSHSGATPAPVWELLDFVLPRAPNVAGIVFELFGSWYSALGEGGLRAELRRVRERWDAHQPAASSIVGSHV